MSEWSAISWDPHDWSVESRSRRMKCIYKCTHTHIRGEAHTETCISSHRPVRIAVAAPPSLPSDKLSLKYLSSFPLRKTRNNTSTFNESCTLPRHPNLLNVPMPGMNAIVRRSSIDILVLLFSELSKVRRTCAFSCTMFKQEARATHVAVVIHTPFIAVNRKLGLLSDAALFFFWPHRTLPCN